MRYQQHARAGIEVRTRHAGEGLCILALRAGRVAGRQDHQIGIELEGSELRGGEEAVIAFQSLQLARTFLRRRQDQARLGCALHLAGEGPMRGEVHNGVVGARRTCSESSFSQPSVAGTQEDLAVRHSQSPADLTQLISLSPPATRHASAE